MVGWYIANFEKRGSVDQQAHVVEEWKHEGSMLMMAKTRQNCVCSKSISVDESGILLA